MMDGYIYIWSQDSLLRALNTFAFYTFKTENLCNTMFFTTAMWFKTGKPDSSARCNGLSTLFLAQNGPSGGDNIRQQA